MNIGDLLPELHDIVAKTNMMHVALVLKNHIYVPNDENDFKRDYSNNNNMDGNITDDINIMYFIADLVKINNFSLIQFYRYCEHMAKYIHADIILVSSFNKNFKLVKLCYENNYEWNPNASKWLSYIGDIQIVEWILNNNLPLIIDIYKCGSNAGQTHILEYLSKRKYKWNNDFCDWMFCGCAALFGNMKALQWGLSHGCACDDYAINCAISYGSLKNVKYVLQYADVHDINELCDSAYECNNIHILRYLYKKGYYCQQHIIDKYNLVR